MSLKVDGTTTDVHGGKLSPEIHIDTYGIPYPIKFAGLFLKSALSTTYDSGATPTYPVAIPCGAGELPDLGMAAKDSGRTDLTGSRALFEGVDYYLPAVADRTGGSSTYTEDEDKFFAMTVDALIPGRTEGVPVAAGANIVVGAEIMSNASGFATTATSTNFVVGKAETPANNVAGAEGAMYIRMKVIPAYKKA